MSEFVYANDPEPRYYNDFGLVEPGQVVTADVAPDWRWEPSDGTTPAPEPTPEHVAEPEPEQVEPSESEHDPEPPAPSA